MATKKQTEKDAASDTGKRETKPAVAELENPTKTKRAAQNAKLTVKAPKLTKEQAEEREPYWVGTMNDSPVQNACVAGISFPRALGPLNDKGDGFTGRPGAIAWLTKSHVKHILGRVEKTVVRRAGTTVFPNLETDDSRYRYQHGDKPLGRYVYMYRLDAGNIDSRPVSDGDMRPLFDPEGEE